MEYDIRVLKTDTGSYELRLSKTDNQGDSQRQESEKFSFKNENASVAMLLKKIRDYLLPK